MRKAILIVLTTVFVLAGCNQAPQSGQPAANLDDPVDRKLVEVAGRGATNCGHLKAQIAADVDAAGKCVMQAAQQKKAFYVAYDLPGLTVGMAGNSDGKLFSLQTQSTETGAVSAVPCPAELRIAPSGRVTCYAPGTFPMGSSSDMHGTLMTMPPTGVSPHQRRGVPPQEMPNPHQQDKSSEKNH